MLEIEKVLTISTAHVKEETCAEQVSIADARIQRAFGKNSYNK